jgi:hypothetical protein
MSKLEKIRESVAKAQQIQDESTGAFRKFQDEVRNEQTAIRLNQEYSAKGKANLIEALMSRKTIELMKGSREMQSEFKKHLSDAKKAAESIVHAKTPAVDSEKMERFTKRFKEVTTEIELASSPRRGKEILEQFLNTIDEPGLAVVVKESFGAVIKPILAEAGTDAAKFKHDLAKSFEDLKTRALDPEATEAMQIVEYADAALNSKFFSSIVEQKVQENFGKVAHTYLNTPDQFFETFKEADKPVSRFRTVEEIMQEEAAKEV